MQFLLTMLCLCIAHSLMCAPPSLKNLHNTCYINASLQNLYNTPLTDFLLQNKERYPQNSFANSYLHIIEEMNRNTVTNSTLKQFVDNSRRLMQTVMQKALLANVPLDAQQDASEFITELLTQLIQEDATFNHNSTPIEDHPINKLFGITLVDTLRCPSAHYSRKEVTQNLSINVQITHADLKTCLKSYFKAEPLNDPKNLPCIEGKVRNDCTKELSLDHTSDVIIIALNRFMKDMYGTIQKKSDPVAVPERLQFGPYMTTVALQTNAPEYELVGTIIHTGEDIACGHYIALIKQNDIWYICDDDLITQTAWKTMQNYLQQSYVLFYQRKDTSTRKTQKVSQNLLNQQHLVHALKNAQIAFEGLSVRLHQ